METSLSRLKKQLASLAEQTTSLDAEANDQKLALIMVSPRQKP